MVGGHRTSAGIGHESKPTPTETPIVTEPIKPVPEFVTPERAGAPAVQSTSLFRALNFELYAKPNTFVMVAGVVAFSSCLGYVAYINYTKDPNAPKTYNVIDDRGKFQKMQRTSRWE